MLPLANYQGVPDIGVVPGWTLPDNGVEYRTLPHVLPRLPVRLPQDWGDPESPYLPPAFWSTGIACAADRPAQFGLLGLRAVTHEPISVNLDDCIALGLFGVPGGGKTYAAGGLAELGLIQAHHLSNLTHPYCVITLPYPNAGYPPEALTSACANTKVREVAKLVQVYRLLPQGIEDLVVLTVSERVRELRRRYIHAQVHGLRFALRDLGGQGLLLLLGLDGTQSPLYARQVMAMLKELRQRTPGPLTFVKLVAAVRAYKFASWVRNLLIARLVAPWVDDSRSLLDWIRAGRHIVLDIRDEWLDSELALLLFSLVVQALVLNPARLDRGHAVPLMVIVDEGHKSTRNKVLRGQLGGMIRERRHLGLRVVVASQDPQSLPQDILALLDGVGVFQHASREWNQCLARAIDDFRVLTMGHTANLPPGVMWFWAKDWHMPENWGRLGRGLPAPAAPD